MKETLTALGRLALRWALWSPRRVAVVVTAGLVLLIVAGAVTGHGKHGTGDHYLGDTSTTEVATSTPSTTTTASAPGTTSTPTIPVSATPPISISTVPSSPVSVHRKIAHPVKPDPRPATAVRFTRLWSTPKPKTWLKTLTPLVTPAELARLRTTNPANVPSMKVTGPGKVVRVVEGVASVAVPTSLGVLYVNVVKGKVDMVATV